MGTKPSLFELFISRVFISALMFGLVGWLLDYNYLDEPFFYVLFSLLVIGGSYFDYRETHGEEE
mgnify:FL=1